MDIGRALREVARERGVTQADVSWRTGLSDSHVSQIFRGKIADPSASRLYAICGALGVDIGELMQRAERLPAPRGRGR